MKIRPVGAELFHANRRKLKSLFAILPTCLKSSQLMLYREIMAVLRSTQNT